ncbi:MAG: Mth938-like domain-containing protein [Nitrospiraceae bacterium]|nr:Mth938-like domain-containing protein [Nitrospiraceae bacterium]
MEITQYEFGRIRIDGKAYTGDLIIYPDRIEASWWRRQGHLLQPEDISGILKDPPDVLIIGTGHNGVMQVSKRTLAALREKAIEFHALKTAEAVKLFNSRTGRKAAALHLTC